jgi:hypothetical protein
VHATACWRIGSYAPASGGRIEIELNVSPTKYDKSNTWTPLQRNLNICSRHTIIKLLRIIFVLVFEKRPIKTPYTKQYSVLIGQFESMHGNKKGFLTNRWGCLNCHNEKRSWMKGKILCSKRYWWEQIRTVFKLFCRPGKFQLYSTRVWVWQK